MRKKGTIKRWCAAVVLCLLITNAFYTIIWRIGSSSPATRWLPMYEWIYGNGNNLFGL